MSGLTKDSVSFRVHQEKAGRASPRHRAPLPPLALHSVKSVELTLQCVYDRAQSKHQDDCSAYLSVLEQRNSQTTVIYEEPYPRHGTTQSARRWK
jgi:hypothetical protein